MGFYTEEDIRRVAGDIWQLRQRTGKPGNSDTDWQEAVRLVNKWESELDVSKPRDSEHEG